MNKDLQIQLNRVQEQLEELEIEYNKSLSGQEVSDRAIINNP